MSTITSQPRPSENPALGSKENVNPGNHEGHLENENMAENLRNMPRERRVNGDEEIETCCCPALYWIGECTDLCGDNIADCIQQCCESSTHSASGGDVDNGSDCDCFGDCSKD